MPKLLLLFALFLPLLSLTTKAEEPATDKEALYRILAAEFSIYRNQYAQAQHFYLTEARAHNHADFAERATRLAMHNQQYADMLEAALIWHKTQAKPAESGLFLSLAYAYNDQANVALDYMQRLLPIKADTDFTRLVNVLPSKSASNQHYLQALTQLNHEYPKSLDIHLALALLHSRDGNSQKALHHMDKANAIDSNHPLTLDYSIRIYTQFQQPEKALKTFRQAIKKEPDNTALRRMYIQLALRHQPEDGRKELNQLLKQNPNDDYLLFNLAMVNMKLQRNQEARQQLQQLIDQSPDNHAAFYYLGIIEYYDQNLDQALAAFSNMSDGPELPQAQEHIARILLEQKRYDETLAHINQQLENANPGALQERLHLLKARTFELQGKPDQALQILNALLSHSPESIDIRYSRAMLFEAQGRLNEMEADLRHIIALHPDSSLALNALGYTLTNRTDRHHEAQQLIDQALALTPEEPAVLDSKGWVLYRLGKNKQALTYLRHAYKLHPDGEIAAHLAEVLWVTGKEKEARKILHEALEKEPDHRILNETIERLNVSL